MEPSAYDASSASRSVMSALAAHQYAQWVARERVLLTESIVEKAHVVLLDQVGGVAEHGDRWRRNLDLGRVVQPHVAARRLRRLTSRDQLGEPLVDLRRRNSQ